MPALYDLLVGASASGSDRTLMECGDDTLTYEQALDEVHTCGRLLQARGLQPASRVALPASLAPRDFLVGAFALSSLCCSVVPVETTDGEAGRAGSLGVQWLLAGDGQLDPWPPGRTTPSRRSADEEVVLSTSGSTAFPKDVAIGSRGLRELAAHGRDTRRVREGDRVAQLYQPTFDPYYGTLVFALTAGATLVYPVAREALALATFVERRRIAVLDCVPHQLRVAAVIRMAEPGSMPGLRVVQIGGERFPPELATLILAAAPNAQVFNVYGPTEATVSATEHELARDEASLAFYASRGVPIGDALPGVRTFVADLAADGTPALPDTIGELWLSGPQVIDGYCDPADDTGRFATTEDGTRWYRTGDRVRTSPRGLLFEGRNAADQKVAGRRVDLGQVEDAVRSGYGSDEAAVVIDDGRLLALVALPPADGAPPRGAAAIWALPRISLPGLRSYAVPALVAACSELPRLPNGKRDTRQIGEALRELARAGRDG